MRSRSQAQRLKLLVSPRQVWPLGREINCKCLRTLSVSEDRSISLQPRLQFDGRYIVCSSDLGVYQWDFSSFEILRQVFSGINQQLSQGLSTFDAHSPHNTPRPPMWLC